MTIADPSVQEANSVTAPAGLPRLLAAADPSLATHERLFGALLNPGTIQSVISELDRAGLAGRGGAAFRTWLKVASAAE